MAASCCRVNCVAGPARHIPRGEHDPRAQEERVGGPADRPLLRRERLQVGWLGSRGPCTILEFDRKN